MVGKGRGDDVFAAALPLYDAEGDLVAGLA